LNRPQFQSRYGFVGVENTSDISSNSSIGSLVTPAAAGDFFDKATPVVTKERSLEIEYERNVVATASRATATNPEINRRFMEKLRWLDMQCGLHHPQYGQRPRVNVAWVTYHDLVYAMWAGSIGASKQARPFYAELNRRR
jgi:hypothetical protein